MAAPTFGAAGTALTGTAANSAVPLPTGIVANEVVIVIMYIESTTSVTPPAGYTQETSVAVTGVSAHTMRIFWHRASGSESGTATFTHSSATREVIALRISGCVTSGDPFDTGTGAPNTASATTSSGVTPAVSLTTTGADELLVWSGTNFDGGAWTPPTGFTERYDGTADLSAATLAQTSAGATGSITGSCTGTTSDGRTAFLGALLPVSGAAAPPQAPPIVAPSLAATTAGSW